MSKAEDSARDSGYGTDLFNREEYTANEVRNAFIEGYHQAEKDNELTNADVYDIWRIYNEVCAEGEIFGFDETSQEVLKRFKDLKK